MRLHYGWIVAATTFAILLVTAGIRSTPGVLMVPFETEFHWNRAVISLAVAINIALFGLIGPFAASLMDQWGLRRVVLGALALLALSVAVSTRMHEQWQLMLLWGVLVGSGVGVTSTVLAAIIATRWFEQRRGLVLGALSAANAAGQLVFVPTVAKLVTQNGWRTASFAVAAAAAIVFVLVLIFMRDRPEDLGLAPYGQIRADAESDLSGSDPRTAHRAPRTAVTAPRTALAPIAALRKASHSPAFWILAGTFFICGASTNGLIATHFIAACHDYGMTEVRAAGLLAAMGIFNILGTTASGWLTDRYSSRWLLFVYYTMRGVSLLFLPLVLARGTTGLGWFTVFYGLDWIATVPPTIRLTSETLGKENTGVVYGWINASHQVGASLAAFGAGAIRTTVGSYSVAFWIAGGLCVLAGLSLVTVGRRTLGVVRTAPPVAIPATY